MGCAALACSLSSRRLRRERDGSARSGGGPVLRGTVHAAGRESPEGLWAVWRTEDGETADSARVQSDGGFEIQASGMDYGGELLVDGAEPLRLADGFIPWETVLVHEMLHVLGVGHTRRIASPMGPCMRTSEISRGDVAYMELLRATLRLAREFEISEAMMPSVIGEGRILLGLPALPGLQGDGG